MIRHAALVVLLLVGSTASAADQATTDAAYELMDALQLKTLLADTIEQSTTIEIEKNPALGPYRKVFLEFMNKHMGYDSIKADLATMYADVFTEQELKQLVAFYHTPVGRKSIQKMPELMARSGQYGEQKVRDNIGELQAMIAAEAQRLQSLQSK